MIVWAVCLATTVTSSWWATYMRLWQLNQLCRILLSYHCCYVPCVHFISSVPSFKTEWYWKQLMDGNPPFVEFHNRVYGCSGVMPNKFPCTGPNFTWVWAFLALPCFPAIPTSSFWLLGVSLQLWREKAWEIWSLTMTTGRQWVDTRGAVSNCSNSHFMLNCPWHCEQRTVLMLPC